MSKAIKFLKQWSLPPWMLIAIAVDRTGIDTATFDDPQLIIEWLTRYHDRNHYFGVNPTRSCLSKKASKTDIAEVAWLHVDIDFRAGEDHDTEYARVKGLLENPPGGVPKPTCVIFSGGGFQAFWRLEKPIPLDGTEATADEAARYNMQLELLFGADSCHNIDRIMRLPGTMNWPDEKKCKKGRVPALAEVLWFSDIKHPLTSFTKAVQRQADREDWQGEKIEVATGNVRRLGNVQELDQLVPGEVKPWLKTLIVQGNRPDDEEPYPSRSEAVWAVCCELVRAGADNDTIYAVITDPDFGISEHIYAQGATRLEAYAILQITRARQKAEDPDLLEFNDRYSVLQNIGGKSRIVEVVTDGPNDRGRITLMTAKDMLLAWAHRTKEVVSGQNADGKDKFKEVNLAQWWMSHKKRRTYKKIQFRPGGDTPGVYNMWRGFAVDAVPGDCSLFLDHVRDNVCSGNAAHYDYVLKWMARAVQYPGKPGYSAIVMKGKQGTGKSFFAGQLGRVFGHHYMCVSNARHLTGNFNGHLEDCVLLFADEAFYAGSKSGASTLKTLISEDAMPVERKGYEVSLSRNCLHMIIASNADWVVPADADDRRFLMLEVSDAHAKDNEYFGRIRAQMDAGGVEALLHYLLSVDLREFDVRSVPKTEALTKQKGLSLGAMEEWWLEKLRQGRMLDDHSDWADKIPTYDLLYDLAVCLRGTRVNVSATWLGRFLTKATAGKAAKILTNKPLEITTLDGKTKTVRRPFYYVFPSLDECRAAWDSQFYREEWKDVEVEDANGEESPY